MTVGEQILKAEKAGVLYWRLGGHRCGRRLANEEYYSAKYDVNQYQPVFRVKRRVK